MEAQINKIVHLGTRYPHFLTQETEKYILDIVGIDNGKCIFLSSGSEAVEFGVQIARRVAEKPLFLTFSNSYLAAYGSAGKKDTDEWELFDWSICEHNGQCDCLDKIPFEKIGGFVFEPGGSGSGFVKFPPRQLVKDITIELNNWAVFSLPMKSQQVSVAQGNGSVSSIMTSSPISLPWEKVLEMDRRRAAMPNTPMVERSDW